MSTFKSGKGAKDGKKQGDRGARKNVGGGVAGGRKRDGSASKYQ
jgi:hypothetical protein